MPSNPSSLRARMTAPLLAAACVLLVGGAFLWARARPSHGRAWRTEQAVLPGVSVEGNRVRVRNVRDFTYRSAVDFTPAYHDRTYHLDRLERVWFVIAPFTRDWRGPAHSFLTFGFADGQYVGVSVEARFEQGEKYSVWKGALRQYELVYVVGEERDLIGLRAVTWDDPVYLYPVRATPAQVRDLFTRVMRRAQALEASPEFYNTLTNNCTTNILDAVNGMRTDPIPFGLRVLLPGYSDRLAYERGLIDTELSLEEARRTFEINDRAKAAIADPAFSARIRT